jgi:hypothetical protein
MKHKAQNRSGTASHDSCNAKSRDAFYASSLGGIAVIFSRTRSAYLEHEQAKAELKSLVPEDAQQAVGYGVRAKRSKSGAISFDLVNVEG